MNVFLFNSQCRSFIGISVEKWHDETQIKRLLQIPPDLPPPSPDSDSGTLSQVGDGRGGHGDALDGALVAAPADPEVAFLAPVAAPAVLYDPELLAALGALAVAHQQHGVVGQLEGVAAVPEAAVVVDALLVVHEVRVDLRGGRRSRERKVSV